MGRFVRTQLTAVDVGTNAARSVTTNMEKTGFKIGVYCLPIVFEFDNGRRPR
jgi:hypothetical protein